MARDRRLEGLENIDIMLPENTEQAKELFRRGYFEAVERLSPSKVVCYGKPFEFMKIDERIKSVGDKFNLTNRN